MLKHRSTLMAQAALLGLACTSFSPISDGPRNPPKPTNPQPKIGKLSKAEKKAAKRARTAQRLDDQFQDHALQVEYDG